VLGSTLFILTTAFALSGYLLFGTDIIEFSFISSAFSQIYRSTIIPFFNYQKFKVESKVIFPIVIILF
jgi:hypothetical protein